MMIQFNDNSLIIKAQLSSLYYFDTIICPIINIMLNRYLEDNPRLLEGYYFILSFNKDYL